MNYEHEPKQYADFITVTCLNWKHVLYENRFKDIIVDSLEFLSRSNRVTIFAFVIMSNHFHLIWQMLGDNRRQDVQRDFLKFTGQQILKILRSENSTMMNELFVQSKDRKYQVWQRNALSVPLWSGKVIDQKLDYIHYNPIDAGLCSAPWEYYYSSASFYYNGDRHWSFLRNCCG